MSPFNPANPASPLSPLNPANPASPFQLLLQDTSDDIVISWGVALTTIGVAASVFLGLALLFIWITR